MPQQQSKPFEQMSFDERIQYLWELKDIWEKRLRETLDLEQVWEEDILLFGKIKIGTKIRRKVWRPKKEKQPEK